jgi:hypothetical protein
MQVFDDEIALIYKNKVSNPDVSINQNMVAVARYFLNRPFLLFALGEGEQGTYDQAPLYRTDAFDCETFVLTVLALSQSNSLESFRKRMLALNYENDQPDFFERNHFTATQWLPNNQKKGFVKDITTKIYPKATRVSAKVNVGTWFQTLPSDRIQMIKPISPSAAEALFTELKKSAPKNKIASGLITFIPRKVILSPKGSQILKKIPDGSIIQFVGKLPQATKFSSSPYYLGHFAVSFHQNGELWLFESSLMDGKVIAIPAKKYIGGWMGARGITVLAPS